jgi:hypothetical protein
MASSLSNGTITPEQVLLDLQALVKMSSEIQDDFRRLGDLTRGNCAPYITYRAFNIDGKAKKLDEHLKDLHRRLASIQNVVPPPPYDSLETI